jgi:hypothetical protein
VIRTFISTLMISSVGITGVTSLTSSQHYVLPAKAKVLQTEPSGARVYVRWIVGQGDSHLFRFRPIGTRAYTIYFSCAGPGWFGFTHIGSTNTCLGDVDSVQTTVVKMTEFAFSVFAKPGTRWEFQISSGKPLVLAPPCRLPACLSVPGSTTGVNTHGH